jgi:hypothetical protein
MTPTASELLMGCVTALSTPPEAEDGMVYAMGKIGVAIILNVFAAQEAATGAAVRVWENAALRSLLGEAGAAPDISDGDFSLAALDGANAELRRALIHLHEAAEIAGDHATDRKILALYREMAARRLLHLPHQPAAA